MIRVDVVLCPGGDQNRPELLEHVYIWNESEDLPEVSNYGVRRLSRNYVTGTGQVTGHNRVTEPVLTLVRKALEALDG